MYIDNWFANFCVEFPQLKQSLEVLQRDLSALSIVDDMLPTWSAQMRGTRHHSIQIKRAWHITSEFTSQISNTAECQFTCANPVKNHESPPAFLRKSSESDAHTHTYKPRNIYPPSVILNVNKNQIDRWARSTISLSNAHAPLCCHRRGSPWFSSRVHCPSRFSPLSLSISIFFLSLSLSRSPSYCSSCGSHHLVVLALLLFKPHIYSHSR